MPFTSETAKLHRGPGGRKRKDPKEVAQVKKMAADLAREYIETHVDPVLQNWGKLAEGWMQKCFTDEGHEYEEFRYDSATTRHFVDKILPNETFDTQRPLVINFVKFDHTVQLQAAGVSATVLAGNGKGHQAIGQGVASPERQGQDGLKFLDFEDVP